MHWEIPSMHARLFHVILFVRCSRSLWHYATLISSFNRLCAGGLKNNNNNANRVQCLTLGLLVHIDELFNRSTCENIEFIKCIDSYDNFDFRDVMQVVPYSLQECKWDAYLSTVGHWANRWSTAEFVTNDLCYARPTVTSQAAQCHSPWPLLISGPAEDRRLSWSDSGGCTSRCLIICQKSYGIQSFSIDGVSIDNGSQGQWCFARSAGTTSGISACDALSSLFRYEYNFCEKHRYTHWSHKGSPYLTTERRAPELIPVLGSQPAGDVNHKPGGRPSLLSVRPAVIPATLKRADTKYAAWWTEVQWVWTVCLSLFRQRRDCDLNPGPSAPESSTLTTRLPSHPMELYFIDILV